MKAGVREEPIVRKGEQKYRVVDIDHPEQPPLLNNSGDPIDGGGHRLKGISEMLAEEANEVISKRTGQNE